MIFVFVQCFFLHDLNKLYVIPFLSFIPLKSHVEEIIDNKNIILFKIDNSFKTQREGKMNRFFVKDRKKAFKHKEQKKILDFCSKIYKRPVKQTKEKMSRTLLKDI